MCYKRTQPHRFGDFENCCYRIRWLAWVSVPMKVTACRSADYGPAPIVLRQFRAKATALCAQIAATLSAAAS
jgi:hypothetical protein